MDEFIGSKAADHASEDPEAVQRKGRQLASNLAGVRAGKYLLIGGIIVALFVVYALAYYGVL